MLAGAARFLSGGYPDKKPESESEFPKGCKDALREEEAGESTDTGKQAHAESTPQDGRFAPSIRAPENARKPGSFTKRKMIPEASPEKGVMNGDVMPLEEDAVQSTMKKKYTSKNYTSQRGDGDSDSDDVAGWSKSVAPGVGSNFSGRKYPSGDSEGPRNAHVRTDDEIRQSFQSKNSINSFVMYNEFNEFVPAQPLILAAKPPIPKPERKPFFRRALRPKMEISKIQVASAETALEDSQIDRRELQWENDVIGIGATAKVFKGVWCGQVVAIKQLNLTKTLATQLRKEVAFLREAAIVAQIKHDSLVQFYGLAFDQQPYLLITEYCGGGTCYDLLHVNDQDLVLQQQLKMCCDIACAMDYLHKFKPQIIHRDLKSLNILLFEPVTTTTDIPHAKVADFGVSKMKDNCDGWAVMTKEVGTPNWMAPEIPTGVYNEKVDVYSFAMVVYEIVCEEVPFSEMDVVEIALAVAKGGRPDMEAVPPFFPNDLVELMVQCWAHQPSDRPSFECICVALDLISRDRA